MQQCQIMCSTILAGLTLRRTLFLVSAEEPYEQSKLFFCIEVCTEGFLATGGVDPSEGAAAATTRHSH